MKKMAVICTLYGPNGGTGRVTTEIIERYAEDGNEIHVYCGKYDEDFIKNSKVTLIHRLNITSIGILQQLDMLIKATKSINRKDYDIIYCTGDYYLGPDIITIHILKKYGRKIIENLEKKGILKNTLPKWKKIVRKIYCPLLFEIGEKIVYRNDRITYIGVSAGVTREFKEEFDKKNKYNVRTIPNGVDTKKNAFSNKKRAEIREKLKIENDTKVLLFVGSDWIRKRLEIAIELCAFYRKTHLIIAGHDNPEEYIKLGERLGCLDRLHFVGFKKNIEDYYSVGDVFLFTSVYETFGLVALEAMAAGMIVISNKVSGVEEYIESGVNGFLTEDASLESFKCKLGYILQHPEMEETVKQNAISTAQEYSWDICYNQYKKIFDDYTRK